MNPLPNLSKLATFGAPNEPNDENPRTPEARRKRRGDEEEDEKTPLDPWIRPDGSMDSDMELTPKDRETVVEEGRKHYAEALERERMKQKRPRECFRNDVP